MTPYKGKGEHSLMQLEKMIEERELHIHQVRTSFQSFEYWLTRWYPLSMTTQKQAFKSLKDRIYNR